MTKLRLSILLLIVSSSLFCIAQPKVKFGQILPEDLEMTRYKNDTSASAVVLYEELDTRYEINSSGHSLFNIVNRYFVRIMILTNDGLKEAERSIGVYTGKTRMNSDILSGLSGFTYNLENGRIEKIKLEKQHIFEEKTSETMTRTKFAFPSVKPGSIIEYRYELTSPHYGTLEDYFFQREIPVNYSIYTLKIPEYFSINKETKGMEPVAVTTSLENQTLISRFGNLSFTATSYEFIAQDLPGLKDEDYVWNIRDYLTRVTFELHSFIVPGVIYETYSNTWNTVDEKLLDASDFGKQLKLNLFKDELASLFTSEMTDSDKVRAVYNMVKSKVKWNEENSFWVTNPRDALKKGVGKSGEINAILISALREAGFNAYPVAMSLRTRGRIPLTHPTINNFNYFIAGVDIDGKSIYLDGVAKYGDLNVMSTSRLTDFARSVRGPGLSSWIDLSLASKATHMTATTASFNEEGVLSGKIQESCGGQIGYSVRNSYSQSPSEQEYFDKKASSQNIEISSYSVREMDSPDRQVYLEYEFTKKDVTSGGNYIYFNPLIIALFNENPFKEEERKLPVEFSFPYDQRHTVTIDIPEGYEVEALPKPSRVSLGDNNEISFQYLIGEDKASRKINISARFSINSVVFPASEYHLIRDFFAHITTSNNEQVVLRKIN